MPKTKSWVILALVAIVSSVALWLPAGLSRVYENFDGPYYLVVAKSWYDKQFIGTHFSFPLPLEYYAAHFPLYPALINLVTALTPLNSLMSMVAVNIAATIVGAIVLYEIFRKMQWGNPLLVALVWLFWWPRMWVVRSVGSPETLFIACVLVSLYGFIQKKYWLAGIAGALAVLTKSPGILLFVTYGLWGIIQYAKTKKIVWKIWPTMLIPLALVGLFALFQVRMGDFFAYFNSGDNIHLQSLPFQIFNSSQPWVGNFWLEDVIWIYLVGGIGVIYALKKNLVFGLFGAVFYASILFVSHRDISRYSLPIVPVILLGLAPLLERKEVKILLVILLIPLYFYSLNFLVNNRAAMADWTPFL